MSRLCVLSSSAHGSQTGGVLASVLARIDFVSLDVTCFLRSW